MHVICLEEDAFYELLNQVVEKLRATQSERFERWLPEEQAMQLLNIKSKTTLQRLRDEGKIRFSQPQKKVILYDRNSIEAYLDKHARDTF